MLVGLNHHQGVAAPLVTVQAHIGHIDPELRQNGRHRRHCAALVLVANYQCVVRTGEIHANPVQLIHHDAPAAKAGGLHFQMLALFVPHFDYHRVGVSVPQVNGINGVVQSGIFCLIKSVGNPQIIRLHAQQTCHQSPISTVPKTGFGKRTV